MRVLPMRCFTCNLPLSGLEDRLQRMAQRGVPRDEAFRTIGLERTCCRAAEMTTIAHDNDQLRTTQTLHQLSEGRVRMETLGETVEPRAYSTD